MPAQAGDTSSFLNTRKAELRAGLRRQRKALSPALRRRAALAAQRHFCRHRVLNRARHVAIYLAHGAELDTAPLLRALHRRGCRLYAPVILSGQRMRFVRLRAASACQASRMDVPQPASRRPVRASRRLDVVLMPLLGFDVAGHRLGQGGGYYDRALAGASRRPLRIGYAYAAQQVAALPAEPWDVSLHGLVSERGLRWFR